MNNDTDTINTTNLPATTTQPIHTELHRLPLWQTTLATMRKEGIRYGQQYPTEWLELRLGANRDSAEFGFAVNLIRRELIHDGFYLTARGQAGQGLLIAWPEDLADIMLRKERRAIDELSQAVILGSNADLRTLTEAQRRRHDAVLSRVAQRAALASRKLPLRVGNELGRECRLTGECPLPPHAMPRG